MVTNYTVLYLFFFLKKLSLTKQQLQAFFLKKYPCHFCSRKKNLSFYEQQKQSSEKGIVSVLPLPKVTKPLFMTISRSNLPQIVERYTIWDAFVITDLL